MCLSNTGAMVLRDHVWWVLVSASQFLVYGIFFYFHPGTSFLVALLRVCYIHITDTKSQNW